MEAAVRVLAREGAPRFTTGALLESILANSKEPAPDRLRSMLRAFFQSEWEEASLRTALGDAVPLYRNAPEVRKHKESGMRRLVAFMNKALPGVPAKDRPFIAAFVMTTISAVGKSVSVEARSKSEVDAWALAMGEMLCAYLERQAKRKRPA